MQFLGVYLLVAFVISLSLSFFLEGRSERKMFQRTVKAKIDESYAQSRRACFVEFELKNKTGNFAVAIAEAIALILESTPSIVDIDPAESDAQNAGLGQLCKHFKLKELSLVNEKGVIEKAFPSKHIGISFHQEPLTVFLQLLENPDEPIVQNLRPNVVASDKSELILYCGVKRLDAPGFIEIGVPAKPIQELYDLGSVSHFVSSTINLGGLFALFNNGKRIGGSKQLSLLDIKNIELNSVTQTHIRETPYYVYAEEHNGDVYVGATPVATYRRSRVKEFITTLVIFFIILVTIILSLSYLIDRFIVSAVNKINKSLEKIANGNLDERVKSNVCKEFHDLSSSVNSTVDSLKSAMNEIRRRSEEELSFAQRIQEAALPNLDSQYAKEPLFDVYAVNRPMNKVGGDMYDCFRLDDTRLLFYVADVSGHGVAGALVMMKTMALVKNLALSGLELTEVVSKTNDYLTENNTTMFVTGFFCIVDLSTGELTYVNAGHNPPLYRKSGQKFEPISPEINLILGIVPNTPYISARLSMFPGDAIMLYTDGITEANAQDSENFEMERTLKALNSGEKNLTSKEIANELLDAVDNFTHNADPSDDETILLFKYKKFMHKKERA